MIHKQANINEKLFSRSFWDLSFCALNNCYVASYLICMCLFPKSLKFGRQYDRSLNTKENKATFEPLTCYPPVMGKSAKKNTEPA